MGYVHEEEKMVVVYHDVGVADASDQLLCFVCEVHATSP